MGKNVSNLLSCFDLYEMFRIQSKELLSNTIHEQVLYEWNNSFTNDQVCQANVCGELLECKYNISESVLSYDECCQLIDSFCLD